MGVGKVIRNHCHNKGLIVMTIIGLISFNFSMLVISVVINRIISDVENNCLDLTYSLYIVIPLFVITIILMFFVPLSYNMLTAKTLRDIDTFTTGNILNLKPSFFKEHSAGEIIGLNKNVSEEVGLFYSDLPVQIIAHGVSLIMFIVVLFVYNYIIAFIILLLMLILSYVISRITKYYAEYGVSFNEDMSIMMGKTHQLIDNYKIIRMLKKEEYYAKKYAYEFDTSAYKSFKKFKLYENTYSFLTSFLTYILPFIVLVFGLLLKDYLLIGTGVVIAMYTLIGNIQEPIRVLASIYGRYKKNIQNENLIKDLVLATPEQKEYVLNEFNKLDFSSKGLTFMDKHILVDINFQIDKGDFVLLKGESGCGKSTILKYIMQEEIDNNIKVFIDGKDVNKIDFNNNILAVTQENYLFSDSVLENITLGQEYTEEDLQEIYKVCVLENFIKNYTVNKVIDNTDSNISGGEKQRICLARILIRKPKLLLIDEITASLDKTTSEIIAKNLYEYAKKYNITVLSISHKDEFDKYANKEVVL